MKVCNKCGKFLDESMFNKDSASKDGLKTICRDCCKAYKLKIRDKSLAYNKEYNQREYVKQQKEDYYNNNKGVIYQRELQKKETNIVYDINYKVIKSIAGVLAGRSKSSMYFEYFNYTLNEFRQHLEKQFTPEMNWSNYGSIWELDHIVPKMSFIFTSVYDKQFKICWSLMNIRPMLIRENRSRPEDGSDISEELRYKILHQFDRKEENL